MNKIYYTKGKPAQVSEKLEFQLVGCPIIDPTLWVDDIIIMGFASIERREHIHSRHKCSSPQPDDCWDIWSYFLVLEVGYAWDLATYAFDTKSIIRGSAGHDALLEFIGLKLLSAVTWKPYADKFFIEICKEDKMWWIRRKWVYRGVRLLGNPEGSQPKEILEAP